MSRLFLVPLLILPAVLAIAVARQAAEFIVLGKSLRRDAAGIRAIAAPILQFLHRPRKASSGGIDPRKTVSVLEGRDIRKAFLFVALQAYAAAAAHFRYLIERENHHLPICADRGDQLSIHRRQCRRLVGHLEIEHLLALAR